MAEEEKKKLSPQAVTNYNIRFTTLKKARDFAAAGDVPKAVEKYRLFLHSIATHYHVTEKELHPSLFDKEKSMGDLLMISHAYWDLATFFDRNPKFLSELERVLQQFVLFTKDFKYQRINVLMMKKFVKKKSSRNQQIFQHFYLQIHDESKSCFVATYAYSETDKWQNLSILRQFKQDLLKIKGGFFLVENYYHYSPLWVEYFKHNPLAHFFIFKLLIYPFLEIAVFLLKIVAMLRSFNK